jgi:hypothetical protein
MHLALSGLAKLKNPKADARRLFMADALIRSDVEPAAVIKALGLGPVPDGLGEYNPDQPRVPAGNPDGGQWTRDGSAGAAADAKTKKPAGVQEADLSGTRGREVRTDATSQTDKPPIVDATYRGKYHDFLRDQFAETLTNAGNTVLKEVPITLPGDQPITAKIDILVRTQLGYVFGIEVIDR